ncbi:hypothetical protein HMPREF1871_00418 [Gemelliphila asaccharolytica]|uniref:Uncharacterized protein n=1 Tax=Gemelliphila asaccharolytica TaxID=502393 RepID=A0ABR5TMT4_9BACL|nr:hypothetical protein HMPREF1871_00418 [Gemella asaccharolytica]
MYNIIVDKRFREKNSFKIKKEISTQKTKEYLFLTLVFFL